ncbi:uncharacterized protein EV154DRAFT_526232 [Mucor mucedo]|uniref:uncharacterized protein n=1 Tax=Mucor mucedo TaxID=29922 RepID=UPI0022203965|nr:uncharacterized protein EV154DRAFT_526232 [Mucor mucedo]KAI7876160.1 hypothetical protein EV154DRAFT_526232 [Mucor mucedo]
MADTMGGAMFLDPEVEAMVLAFFCLISIMLVSILVWLILICLRVDASISWPWSVVFIPLWIVDGLILWATIYRIKNYDPVKNDELNHRQQHEQAEEEEDEGNEQDGLLGGQQQTTSKKQHIYNQFIPFIQCCFVLIFQVLIVLRLDHHFPYSVVYVFLPFYAYEVINTIKNGRNGWLTRSVLVIQMTFILLQLLYIKKEYTWFIVFIPIYCLGVFFTVKLYRQYKKFANYPTRQEAQQGQMLITIASVIYAILSALFYTVLALIARRLDGSSHVKLSVILIPVFIILSVLLCCTGCCFPCMLVASSLPTEDTEENLQQQGPTLVNSNRRITE